MSAHVRASLSNLRYHQRRFAEHKDYDHAVALQGAMVEWREAIRRGVIVNTNIIIEREKRRVNNGIVDN